MITAVIDPRRSSLANAECCSSPSAFCATSPRCASPLDGKEDLIDHRGEQPRLRRTKQRPTVDHHAVIAPFQLAQIFGTRSLASVATGSRRVGRQRQIIKSKAWGASYKLKWRLTLQEMQDFAVGGPSKLARDRWVAKIQVDQ